MQWQQQIYTIQEGVSDRMSPAFTILAHLSKSQDKQQDEHQPTLEEDRVKKQQVRQNQVTQQPNGSNNRDHYDKPWPTNTSTKKKKKRRPRCSRRAKQSDKECCDTYGTSLCNNDSCCGCFGNVRVPVRLLW